MSTREPFVPNDEFAAVDSLGTRIAESGGQAGEAFGAGPAHRLRGLVPVRSRDRTLSLCVLLPAAVEFGVPEPHPLESIGAAQRAAPIDCPLRGGQRE
ncbi:hypothetical protein GoPhGRU1p43 [Gordonia phage GRU1]|uniref:Uncharacterized protein n=1 Tax=Gordonia phage GRU1 TaxID=1109710 RepID=G8EK02_9CAUD|nr:hypothetical protein GoPhGRU1p43 [Gordonia phage GRU1]AET09884.1 hypothetical protein [Gordonia phage GRU1]